MHPAPIARIQWDCCELCEFDTLNGTMLSDTTHRTLPTARLTRRDLLRAGVAGGLGLPTLLHADSGVSAKVPKSCIFIHQYGGLSQLDSCDPKPGAPQEVRGPYKPIDTATPGSSSVRSCRSWLRSAMTTRSFGR